MRRVILAWRKEKLLQWSVLFPDMAVRFSWRMIVCPARRFSHTPKACWTGMSGNRGCSVSAAPISSAVSHRPVDIGFTHFPQCWGWATWARAWEGYDMELKGWDDSFIDEIADEGIIPSFKPEAWKQTFHFMVRNPSHTWDCQFWFLSSKGAA